MDSKYILPVWQPIGCSTNYISQQIGEKLEVKTSHTGTIDPMAEGVVVVLLGEERLKKYEYAKWIKEYIFEIIFGVKTDTYDGMGLIININFEKNINDKDLRNLSRKFLGKYSQKIPIYSSKKINGKQLHQYARIGRIIDTPIKHGKIYQFKLLRFNRITAKIFVPKILKNIKKINGDFRQKEIISQWKYFEKQNSSKKFYKAKFCVQTSKGLYIRSLSQDICHYLGAYGFTYKLIRTRNGIYSKTNSDKIEDILNK